MAKDETISEKTVAEENAAGAEATDEAVEGRVEEVAADDLMPLLEDARAKADEHWNQLLRVKADMENTRRRAKQDVENAHKFALEKFALELLPIKDSLEMGLTAADGVTENSDATAQLKEGTALTLKMLTTALEKFGIEAVDPIGDTFDPDKHQAMSIQESADHKPNTVIAVMQKGYQLNERLLRPAMVVVSKAVAEKTSDSESGNHINEQA
ncbi:MAG TPA: nucleotide exchange factor GrpE [Gammaproteobacteria bacterium]|nr:nucleotide exchange factor GrpE [Gammaproteobacteria bacterium]